MTSQGATMTRRDLVALGIAAMSIALPGCVRKRAQLRYRVTLEVDGPSGLLLGSSVLENRDAGGSHGLLQQIDHGSSRVDGEAPFVDLGSGKLLVAVLEDSDNQRTLSLAARKMLAYRDGMPAPSPGPELDWFEAYKEASGRKPSAPLHRVDYPMLVSFRDAGDPTTVFEVDPDDLSATFGAGFSLRRISIAVTDDPVTFGDLDRRLPWLPAQKGSLVKSYSLRARGDTPSAELLNEGSFRSPVQS